MVKQRSSLYFHLNRLAQRILNLVIPLGIYWFILVNRYPFPLRPISMAVRYSLTFVLPALFIFFLLVFLVRGRWQHTIHLSAALLVFGLALAGLWAKGESDYYVISGLIPFVDASSYLNEARRILEGFQFTEFAAWRPIFPVFLAPLLAITQHNLQFTLALIVLLAAICCLLLCLEIRRTLGAAPAAFIMTILFLYYRIYVGTITPENFGFSLGCLGFALLWRGATNKGVFTIWLGVFLTSLALFCRLGALLVLPALVIWCGWLFRKGNRFSWYAGIWSSAGITTAFLLYLAAGALFSGSVRLPVSYYSTVFYDLSSGYPTKYGQINEDYPIVNNLPEPHRTREIYRLAFNRIYENPADLLQGAFSQWQLFFSYTWYGVYGFLIAGSQWVTMILYIGMYVLCLLGFISFIVKRQDEHLSLTIFTTLAILLSVPFVPPRLFNRIRLYASSIPILVVLPGMGLHYLLSIIQKRVPIKKLLLPDTSILSGGSTAWLGISFSIFMIVGAVCVLLFSHPTRFSDISCDQGFEPVYIKYNPGSQVNIIPEHIYTIDWLPNFHNGKFRWYLHSAPHYGAITEFENIVRPPATIINSLDLKSGRQLILVADSNLFPDAPALLGICGKWSIEPQAEAYHLFYGEKISVLSK